MNKQENRKTGAEGESLAVSFLQKKRYTILATNVRSRFAEIDIVALQGNIICFVEVKNRSSDYFGMGAQAVNSLKQKKIMRLAEQFILRNRYLDYDIRFDVIDISSGHIEHLEDAFQTE